jgi:aminoglycoside 3-N-acetyltransferase
MSATAVSGARLARDLRELGVRRGGVLMVHTRMSALGWVVGGSETVVRALLDVLGPDGTLAAYASWQEHVDRAEDRPAEHRDAYAADPPAFDPATGEVDRDYGRIPERVRTWPGAMRSAHPEASVAAVGARAAWLTEEHPEDDGYGARSPFARIVEADGQVLMLGAPLETVTLLHHAEAMARVAGKRTVTYRVTLAGEGGLRERTYTARGALRYDRLGLDDDEFAVIARAALDAGIGARDTVGDGASHLFPAPALTAFAIGWMEERFA